MNIIQSTTDTLASWADIHGCLSNMTKLEIVIGDRLIEGEFELHEENGVVSLVFPEPEGRPKKWESPAERAAKLFAESKRAQAKAAKAEAEAAAKAAAAEAKAAVERAKEAKKAEAAV